MADVDIRARLFALADGRYRDFQSGLIPGLDPGRIIGVRTPALRALARELAGTDEAERLMDSLPHEYYEEDNLHALFINAAAGYDAAAARLERFLPHVDNWATCDLLKPKAFKKRPEGLEGLAARWMGSAHTYTARFGIGVYMNFYLGEGFDTRQLDAAARCCRGDYYVDMMVAWYFATALAKREAETLPYLTGRRLSPWAHNKTIQKACESFRISPELKERLKGMKVKA